MIGNPAQADYDSKASGGGGQLASKSGAVSDSKRWASGWKEASMFAGSCEGSSTTTSGFEGWKSLASKEAAASGWKDGRVLALRSFFPRKSLR